MLRGAPERSHVERGDPDAVAMPRVGRRGEA